MQDMISFSSWIFNNLPNFLLSEPIKYFTGLIITMFVVKVIFALIGIERR